LRQLRRISQANKTKLASKKPRKSMMAAKLQRRQRVLLSKKRERKKLFRLPKAYLKVLGRLRRLRRRRLRT
jgi:hypothetical protein